MDSLTHVALGAAIGLATMGRRTAPWKAALWGAVAATLPDLDVFIDHGDPIRNMVLHRAETHAPFWLTLFSIPFAAAVARLHGGWDRFGRWWLALWLALISHALLDGMTVYGTQLGLPFTSRPYGVGSIFIIDPLYTLPLLVGVAWSLRAAHGGRGRAPNLIGLALSTAYLGWGVVAQQQVEGVARQALAAQGIAAERVLVTPTAFNSLLWRVVAVGGEHDPHFHEGFRSLLDDGPVMHFDRFERGTALAAELQGIDGVRRIQAFSRGFWAMWESGGRAGITDLRMGQEPDYIFRFAVAERRSTPAPLPVAQQLGSRPDLERGLTWLARRALGEPLPPPR
ncbi:MAG: metal-dependent hydrolase [Burkholderiales bacterium]|nr:metal-dependent hydrolase [Burkholderiales bacterium]